MSEEAISDLPEGWCPVSLGRLVQTSKKKIEPSEWPDAPYLGLEHIESGTGEIIGRGVGADVASTKAVFSAGDVLYGKLRPYLNKVCVPDFDGICSTDILVFEQTPAIHSALLRHFLSLPENIAYANHHSTGVQLPRVAFKVLGQITVPVPPLAEQRRIVAKVEALLARVQATRDRLARLPLILKRFRQAILAAACNGQLTADWRDHNEFSSVRDLLSKTAETVDQTAIKHLLRRGTSGLPSPDDPDVPEIWVTASVRNLVRSGAIVDFQDGNHGSLYPRSADFGETGVRFLTAQQVFNNRVLIDETPLLKREKAKQLRIGFAKPRDVLLTHNATVGRVAVLPDYDGELILGTSVTYYRTNPLVLLPEFLSYQMQGRYWQDQLQSVMEQTTRNQVSVTKQVEFSLFVPPPAEQIEIVRKVDALFKLAETIERRVAAAAARADKLAQAILAKAFRGELVPTEAELARAAGRDYETAEQLLERIRRSAADSPDTPAPNGRPKAARRPLKKVRRA